MRIHVLLPPHSLGRWKQDLTCAFTQRGLNLAKAMADAGQEVFVYGPAGGTDVGVTGYVSVLSEREYQCGYGRDEVSFYDCDRSNPICQLWNYRVQERLAERLSESEKDIVCCTFGTNQEPAVRPHQARAYVVESGIGYRMGTFAPCRIFESSTWMHYHAGMEGLTSSNPKWRTIYNTFDPEDFDASQNRADYLLYLGRLIPEKGVEIAVDTALATERPILLAGPGDPAPYMKSNLVSYLGVADRDLRKQLMAQAAFVMMPTQYIEPLGYVHLEAMMSGAPVITSNWGAFTETVVDGVGARCRGLSDYVRAVGGEYLPANEIRQYALGLTNVERFTNEHIAFFQMLQEDRL